MALRVRSKPRKRQIRRRDIVPRQGAVTMMKVKATQKSEEGR
ncbi:hypothetical protein CCACVL1_02657 [Corchorus capsularis]|uniref:Uncharacterized protein n=1 Tax=Corchorus capsularis TaxID=210143 RepID=A0A1R3K759_COCAP|nr:hypothetical protein CCACVL1_02657 [Corchorus capsularis]